MYSYVVCNLLHHNPGLSPTTKWSVERWHRTLNASLMARCCGPDCVHQLLCVLPGLRTIPKEGLTLSVDMVIDNLSWFLETILYEAKIAVCVCLSMHHLSMVDLRVKPMVYLESAVSILSCILIIVSKKNYSKIYSFAAFNFHAHHVYPCLQCQTFKATRVDLFVLCFTIGQLSCSLINRN